MTHSEFKRRERFCKSLVGKMAVIRTTETCHFFKKGTRVKIIGTSSYTGCDIVNIVAIDEKTGLDQEICTFDFYIIQPKKNRVPQR